MASASLSIPIALWTSGISTAAVSATLTREHFVVAGLEDGLIWVFTGRGGLAEECSPTQPYSGAISLDPTTLLIGHSSRVTALEAMLADGDGKSKGEWILISASEDGEVKKWSLADGRCLQSNPSAFIGVPTYLGVLPIGDKSCTGGKFIVCAGTSSEACIMDSTSLEVVRVWGGHLDWVNCTTLPGDEQHQSRILSVSADCKFSIWNFNASNMTIAKINVLEICMDVRDSIVSLVTCQYDASWVALVMRNSAQIACVQPDKRACYMIQCPEKESFVGAAFLALDDIVIWTQSGRVFMYSISRLHQNTLPSTAEGQLSSDVEPRIPRDVVATIGSEQAPLFKLHQGYIPSLLVFKIRQESYLLSLKHDPQGLSCLSVNLRGKNSNHQAGNEPIIHETWIRWDRGTKDSLPTPSVTCSVMLSDMMVALGRNCGEVWVTPIDEALSAVSTGFGSQPLKQTMVLKGHVGPVTSMFISEDLMQRSFLMTGGSDCSARIWNLESGIEVACFSNHSRPVAHFLQVPDEANSRIKRSVVSIAEDHSIAIISIEEMSCIYLFGGYEHSLLSIQWRPPEDYVVLWHADGTAFVWQMQTGQLDRIIKGEAAREVMMDARWSVSEISSIRAHSSKLAFDWMTVPLDDTVGVQMVVINLKHILNLLSPARVADQQSDYPGAPGAVVRGPAHPDIKKIHQHQRDFIGKPKGIAPDSLPKDQSATVPDKIQRTLCAARGILSQLVTEDDAHSISIRKLLGLGKPSPSAALGMRGAYGNVSVSTPAPDGDLRESWCISSALTASKLIAVLSLSKTIASVLNLDVDMDTWSQGYCRAVQDSVGPKYCPPSLSFLAKYWQDPQVEIQEAARVILLSAIERMSKSEIASLVKYWSAFLPAATLPDSYSSQYMARSAVILGILGAENAEALPERVRMLVALSLTILLNDDSRISYKVASIDLLAQGFATWQPYIRADAVLNTLFVMAMDSQTGTILVSRRARRAIAQIAIVNPALFVATLTQDIMDAKKSTNKIGLLKLVSIFARKNPAVLYNGVHRLAEAIVKSLDPTQLQMREQLLPVATSVMMDLVQSFPQLDFHVGSQKLAVGTLEGAIVVYDLQTATRWQILEGHTGAVSAVSFSRDGKTIVSCSIKEGTVRLWHPNPGFFGMLMGGSALWGHSKSSSTVGSGGLQSSIPSLSSQQPIRTFDFALQDSIATGTRITPQLRKCVWSPPTEAILTPPLNMKSRG